MMSTSTNHCCSLLKLCCETRSHKQAMKLHCHLLKILVNPEPFLYNNLINTYGKLGNLKYARHIFDKMPQRDQFSWNFILTAYAKTGHLLQMQEIFKIMPNRDEVSWNSLISGYACHGSVTGAIKSYKFMLRDGVINLDTSTFSTMLGLALGRGCVDLGWQIHGQIVKFGFGAYVFVGNTLVDMYAKLGLIYDAKEVFDEMPERNVVTRNTMITGLIKKGLQIEAIDLFRQMRLEGLSMDQHTFSSVLTACAGQNAIEKGKQIHAFIIRSNYKDDVFVGNALVNMYCKCKNVQYAEAVFKRMTHRDVVSWTAVLAGYGQNGFSEEAIRIFYDMLRNGIEPNDFTLGSVISSCANLASLEDGVQFHCRALITGLISFLTVSNALVTLYGKCGSIKESTHLFNEMNLRNVVSWTTMITVLIQNGLQIEAVDLFRQMRVEGLSMNQHTFSSVLSACAGQTAIEKGKQIHAFVIRCNYKDNVFVSNALVDMYCKCKNVRYAEVVFKRMAHRDVVSWNALVVGYGQNGLSEEAIRIFCDMHRNGIEPNDLTLGSVISSCANLGSLEEGSQFHCRALITGLISFVTVSTALVTLYGKCGSIEESTHLFKEMKLRDEVSWTALITSYAQFGKANETIELFERMLAHGLKPDAVTFTGVLSACSRAGLVERGEHYFKSMLKEHGLRPGHDHYNCMIDLFSRAGKLEEAKKLIKKMPFSPDARGWSSLLSSCRFYDNTEIGKWASQSLLELEPHNRAGYILLSSIHAAKGEWNDVAELRKRMRERGVQKEPGLSWITYKNKNGTCSSRDFW